MLFRVGVQHVLQHDDVHALLRKFVESIWISLLQPVFDLSLQRFRAADLRRWSGPHWNLGFRICVFGKARSKCQQPLQFAGCGAGDFARGVLL